MLYRLAEGRLEVFLAHPGGPRHRKRDDGAWTIPKGEIEEGEALQAAALREFEEEIGFRPDGPLLDLGEVTQKGGKVVRAWAVEGDVQPGFELRSNHFTMEWPPRSGRRESFPEVDRAAFFGAEDARRKLRPAQAEFVARLASALGLEG
jgi:predicted NUDIX family NTP pyrophosphohydrolase